MTADATGPVYDSPVDATRAFVEAVGWGEHRTVWQLLSQEGRRNVLRVAVNQGMEESLAARLREGTAAEAELDQFLAELVTGLRADLLNVDVDNLEYELGPEPLADGASRVELLTPVPPELGAGLPAGSAELSEENGSWRVNRLVPRRSLSG
jgi:hypothetical protein